MYERECVFWFRVFSIPSLCFKFFVWLKRYVHTYIVLLLITYVCSYVSDFITGYYFIFIES